MKLLKSLLPVVVLALAFPADASQFTTSTLLSTYTANDVGNITLTGRDSYDTQLANTPSLTIDGSSSGSTVLQASSSASGTLTLPAATDTLAGLTATQTLTNKTFTSPTITAPTITGATSIGNGATITTPVINSATGVGQAVFASSTSSTAFTSNATLGAITGLSVPVVASGTYYCRAYLPITANASGGVQAAFAGASSMTATSASYTGFSYNGSTLSASGTTTTFGNAVAGATAADTYVSLEGTVVVNAAGNLIVEGAQNASNSNATTFLANASLWCLRTN